MKERGDFMDVIIRHDIRKLIADTERVRQALETLEEDHAVWARRREERDLATSIEKVKQLEFDISSMMCDCSSSSRYEEGRGVMEGIHHVFACLNTLFQDLKKAREDLNEAYIHPDEIEQLEIDWGRLRKTVEQIQRCLHEGENF
jgi:hypothetical protein